MSEHGISRENLLRTFPVALREDAPLAALGESTAALLAGRLAEIGRLRIYANIGALPEELLDILAKDFKVDWWDADYSLAEKRRTLQSSWLVHRRLGTKAAVESALGSIYPGARVEEWFDYDGEPYHFRLRVETGGEGFDPERHRKVLQRVAWYKNLRSWMDVIAYEMPVIPAPEVPGTGTLRRLRIPLRFVSYGLDAARLDASRLLDGSWTLLGGGWGIPMPVFRLSLALREAAGCVRSAAALRVSTPGLEERVKLRQAAVFRFRTGTLTLLDGARPLDGSWTLAQNARGIGFPQAVFALSLLERTQIRAGPLCGGSASARPRERAALHRAGTGCAAREGNDTALRRAAWAVSCQNPNGGGPGTLTSDRMWRLDGGAALNGRKLLNAAITKEEL